MPFEHGILSFRKSTFPNRLVRKSISNFILTLHICPFTSKIRSMLMCIILYRISICIYILHCNLLDFILVLFEIFVLESLVSLVKLFGVKIIIIEETGTNIVLL